MKQLKYIIFTILLISYNINNYSQEYTFGLKEAPLERSSFLGINSYDILDTQDMLEIKKLEGIDEQLFDDDYKWHLSLGTAFAKNSFIGEVGVIYGFTNPIGIMGLKIGSEFLLNTNFCMGPKIGAEIDIALLSTRLSLINYTNFKAYEPKITPEIGFSILGYVNITYGYNIPLTPKRIKHIPTHRLSITVNLPLSQCYFD